MSRSPPWSEECERAVLGSIVLHPPALLEVADRLRPDAFYLERHRILYQTMLDLQAAGIEIDLRTLQARLEVSGKFDQIGGLAFVATLDDSLPELGRIRTYADTVIDRALRRQLADSCDQIRSLANDSEHSGAEALAASEELLFELGQSSLRTDICSLAEAYTSTIERLEQRSEGMLGLRTGFYDWDRMTLGLVGGNLVVIAGRPGSGKTCFALNVAQHVAFRADGKVLLFSVEMDAEELTLRLLSSEAQVPFKAVRAARMSELQWERVHGHMQRTQHASLSIDATPAPTVAEIAAKARRHQRRHGLDLLVIDYLQLLEGNNPRNRNLEISAMTRALKRLAKELRVPIMLLSQLSRQTERRTGNHRPQLADLRDSGSIEQDADMVCFIYRDELYNKDDPSNKGLAELIVSKQRNGETGTVPLVFVGEMVTFRSFDRRGSSPF